MFMVFWRDVAKVQAHPFGIIFVVLWSLYVKTREIRIVYYQSYNYYTLLFVLEKYIPTKARNVTRKATLLLLTNT